MTDTTTTTQTHNSKTALTDDIRTHFGGNAPIADKVRGFAKARPGAAAAFAAGAAAVLFSTLRGRR